MSARILSLAVMGIIFNVAGMARAGDAVVPDKGFAASRYESLWTKSPFAVATPEEGPESTDYALVGIAQFDGISYANLIDKQSQEHFLLGSDKPVRGLTLKSVVRGHDPAGTSAVIQKNGELITLKLGAEASPAVPNGPGVVPTNSVTLPGGQNAQNISPGMFRPANAPPGVMVRPHTITIPLNPQQQRQQQQQAIQPPH